MYSQKSHQVHGSNEMAPGPVNWWKRSFDRVSDMCWLAIEFLNSNSSRPPLSYTARFPKLCEPVSKHPLDEGRTEKAAKPRSLPSAVTCLRSSSEMPGKSGKHTLRLTRRIGFLRRRWPVLQSTGHDAPPVRLADRIDPESGYIRRSRLGFFISTPTEAPRTQPEENRRRLCEDDVMENPNQETQAKRICDHGPRLRWCSTNRAWGMPGKRKGSCTRKSVVVGDEGLRRRAEKDSISWNLGAKEKRQDPESVCDPVVAHQLFRQAVETARQVPLPRDFSVSKQRKPQHVSKVNRSSRCSRPRSLPAGRILTQMASDFFATISETAGRARSRHGRREVDRLTIVDLDDGASIRGSVPDIDPSFLKAQQSFIPNED